MNSNVWRAARMSFEEALRMGEGSAAVPDTGQKEEGAAARYRRVRCFTESLCEPLVAEDYVVQSMPDASPAKWHLAHTSWFFETFILTPTLPDYRPFHPSY